MIYNLQLIRAIAAYMVVIHHIGTVFVEREVGIVWPNIGASGVDIFFVISGFIIVHTTRSQDVHSIPFFHRRIERIVPLYALVTLLIWLLVQVGFRPNGLGQTDGTLDQLFMSLLFVPFERSSGHIYPLLSVGWTLNFEMLFYLVFAIAIAARRLWNPVHLVLVAMCVLVGLGMLTTPASPVYLQFFLSPLLLEFAAGAVIALLMMQLKSDRSAMLRRAGLGALALGIAILVGTSLLSIDPTTNPWLRVVVWGGAGVFIVLGALLLERSGVQMRSKFALLQGDASYATYLIHTVVLQIGIKVVAGVLELSSVTTVTLMALGLFVMSGVVGTALHLWVERPMAAWLRRPRGAPSVRVTDRVRGLRRHGSHASPM